MGFARLPSRIASIPTLTPALAGLALFTSCDDTQILTIPPPAVQVDELKQAPAALVDILWVVDNSESMIEEQASLADNFDRFISGLTLCQGTGVDNDVCDFDTKTCMASGAPCNPPNYQIGVIATDVISELDQGKLRRVGLCVPSVGATPANNNFQYCLNNNADCTDAANGVCDMGSSLSFVTPNTPGASAAFSRAVRVGTGGSGLETGIRAAALALGRDTNRTTGQWMPSPTENTGFLRPDASLFIIFVSDEDDSSFGEVTYFYRAFETLKGAGNEGVVSVSAIVGDPDVDGVDGTALGGCPAGAAPGERIAQAGTRYVALSMYSRGLSSEFRVCDGQRLVCPGGFNCASPVPNLPGVCIPDATTSCQMDQDCGNFKCEDGRGCILCNNAQCELPQERFSNLLREAGVFESICRDNYAEVLRALGFEAAGLVRKFELTRFPNCPTQDKDLIPCCGAGVADDACTAPENQVPVCVKVNGEPVTNDRTTGYVYETASNAIFFDGSFVPPTDATITISYRAAPESATKAINCEGRLN